MIDWPSVSIIIPCRNEEKYIARCLDSVLANDYDEQLLEIVVVDGMSTDRTQEIVKQYCQKYDFIKMLDNPKIIKPVALNLGIKATQSDVVMRIDAHSIYESDYISKLVEGLFKYKADNIGGVRDTDLGGTLLSMGIGIAISHPFAVGNAYYRIGSKKTLSKVDTVFCGCYRRDVFERIGYFNEKLIRTQDREFNARLTQAGGVIILDPSVRCTYYPRTQLKEYCKWTFAGAYWVYYASRFTETKMRSWRNVIPLLFVGWHFSLILAAFFTLWLASIFALPVLTYWAAATFFSCQVGWQHKRISLIPIMLILFASTHYLYGFGGIIGLMKSYILRKDLSA